MKSDYGNFGRKRRAEWNLSLLFEGDGDPGLEREREIIEGKAREFIDKWKGRRDYLLDPAVMKEALDDFERWNRLYGTDGNAGYYWWLRTQQDQSDPGVKAQFNKIEEFSRRIENEMQFFHLRIAAIPPKKQRLFLGHRGLKKYRHFLERIFAESEHLLSEPEERILNLKSATSGSNWVRMTAGFLAKEMRTVASEDGGKEVKTFAEISSLMNSSSRNVRDSAARAFNDVLLKFVEVAEAEINSVLANKKVDDELRGFTRPDQSRHISDDVDSEIVDSLVECVSERFDIPARYYRLKAELMGVRKLRYHERNVEYGEISGKFTYARAVKLVQRVLLNLDGEFAGIYERFVRQGQIDVYPRKGKTGGAFCVHHTITQPTFILLNHTNRLHDVLTIAHELGHGINNELIRRSQNALNFGTPTSTAEVASTFMEDFVLEEILRGSGDKEKLTVMMMKLNDDMSTIFRQVACYRFEQELHAEFRRKGYLPKEEIGSLFQKHMAAYMGEAVEQSKGSENWWVYWSHIRYFFYVYSYAGGLLISKSLQRSVKNDRAFIGKVKAFLSAGLSDSPRNIFRKLGIDISEREFWNRGLDEVDALLGSTEALAKKTGALKA